MRPDLFTTVISFDEALRRVLDVAVPVEERETIALPSADGRVCAADVSAPADVPAFDRAAMDGYAVRSADLENATHDAVATLVCVGEIFTGDVPTRTVNSGECMAIATGAPVPPGADAVVMVEATRVISDRDSIVGFTALAPVGQNVSPRGADMHAGDLVARVGDAIGPARVGSLAAIGLTHVEVFRRPSVALLSTGNEVTPPGQALPPSHVYDVNSFTVAAVVRRHGGIATRLSSAEDTLEALLAVLDAASTHDVIVFSGGSSVGRRNLMLDAVQARGEVLFHGIAVKPGKPTLLARVGRTIVFGMPGNPASCLSNAYMLLVPFLRKMARLPAWQPQTIVAPLARRVMSTPSRHQFYPVRLAGGRVEPAFKSSGDITSMANADGYIEIPMEVAMMDVGEMVTVTLF